MNRRQLLKMIQGEQVTLPELTKIERHGDSLFQASIAGATITAHDEALLLRVAELMGQAADGELLHIEVVNSREELNLSSVLNFEETATGSAPIYTLRLQSGVTIAGADKELLTDVALIIQAVLSGSVSALPEGSPYVSSITTNAAELRRAQL